MKTDSKLLEINPTTHLDDKFRPHASYEATLIGDMVHAEVTGPLNLEALKIYSTQLKPVLSQLPRHQPIGWLTVFHLSMMMPPDGVELFAQKAADLAASGVVWAAAHVAGEDVEGRTIMSGVFASKVFGPAKIPYQLFSNRQDAIAWLELQQSQRAN